MSHLVVVPSPGPGKAIQVVSVSFRLYAGKKAHAFTNDMVLTAGRHARPQFSLEAAVINSSFDEWVQMVALERGSLKEDEAITFGPSAGASASPSADSAISFDIAYRVVKA